MLAQYIFQIEMTMLCYLIVPQWDCQVRFQTVSWNNYVGEQCDSRLHSISFSSNCPDSGFFFFFQSMIMMIAPGNAKMYQHLCWLVIIRMNRWLFRVSRFFLCCLDQHFRATYMHNLFILLRTFHASWSLIFLSTTLLFSVSSCYSSKGFYFL